MMNLQEYQEMVERTEDDHLLKKFIVESNAIEGIFDEVGAVMIRIYQNFLDYPAMTVTALSAFVRAIEPRNGRLRDKVGMDVRVGRHIAPPGSPDIPAILDSHLRFINNTTPYKNHLYYENLHPYMDGNGRSGRALWLRQAYHLNNKRMPRRGFLHQFYYDTLDAQDARDGS